jgi:hypothetical protein
MRAQRAPNPIGQMPAAPDAGCPLCRASSSRVFAELRGSTYFRCGVCALTYGAPADHPSPEQELLRYAIHQNDPADPRYRAYLAPLAEALAPSLAPGAEGLDYGSGPGPALPLMLEERGFRVALYDPFFAPDATVLTRQYDFITCSETAEHFAHPAEEFARFDRLLRPRGWLGVMTQLLEEDTDFARWHYARDVTHLCFYTPQTMTWIAERYGWSLAFPHQRVVLFGKGA